MLTPSAAPPEPMEPNEAWIEIGSTIAIAASNEVQASMQAAIDAQRGFLYAIEEYRARLTDPTSDWEPNNPKSPAEKLQDARIGTLDAIKAAQTVMRDELADL
jgi:hypothetical protein